MKQNQHTLVSSRSQQHSVTAKEVAEKRQFGSNIMVVKRDSDNVKNCNIVAETLRWVQIILV